MVVSVGISEVCRNRMGVLICVFCCFLSLSGLSLVGLGLFLQIHIHDQLILLESYDDGLLPNFLVGVGGVMTVVNAACAKLSYDCGFASTREKFRMAMIPLLIVMFLFVWVIMSVAIICMAHRASVEDALHGGLEDALGRYKSNVRLKVAVDRMQMKNRCCGSRAYTDWFNVGWINLEYVNQKDPRVKAKMKDGNLLVDSVPFSCCDVKAARPCVSHYVMNKTRHVNYDSPTLYMAGCTDMLMDRLENRILRPVGFYIFALFGVQVLVMALVRYLQTSIVSAFEEGNPEGVGTGFLFPNCCASCTTGDPDKYAKKGALDLSLRAGADSSADATFDSADMTGAVMDFGGDAAPDNNDKTDKGGVMEKPKSKWSPKKPEFLKKLKMPKKPKSKKKKSPKKKKK